MTDNALDYWKRQLAGALPLELPTDRVRPAGTSHGGARHEFRVPSEVSDRLRVLSRDAGATLFTTLLAAFQVVLGRRAGQDDIAIGVPVANRTSSAAGGLIGFLANTVIVRTDLSGDIGFLDLLRQVSRTLREAWANRDVSFDRVVQELDPTREGSWPPLFRVLFQFSDPGEVPFALGQLAVTRLPASVVGIQFDLSVELHADSHGLAGGLDYSTDLYEAETVARIVGHYVALLNELLARPTVRLRDLDVLDAEERRRVVMDWNRTAGDEPAERLVHARFEENARRTPNAVAVVGGGESVTYGDLNARAGRLAARLRRAGVGGDTVVGICLDRSPAIVVATMAVLKAGGAFLHLDPGYPDERIELMRSLAGASVVVTTDHLWSGRSRDGVVVVDPRDGSADRQDRSPSSTVRPDNLACVIYTSGSTGRPKGVAVTHRGIVNYLDFAAREYEMTARDVVLQLVSFSFSPSVRDVLAPLSVGGCVVIATGEERTDPAALLGAIREQRVTTVLSVVPTLLALLVAEAADHLAGRLRLVMTAGESLQPALAERALEGLTSTLVNQYGLTECTMIVSRHRCSRTLAVNRRYVPIGRPIGNVRTYVVDADMRPVPIGAVGELHVAGVGLARGYVAGPDLTAASFVPDPFSAEPGGRLFRTGDLVRWRANGDLELVGRADSQVKVRGFRVEPGEVEAALGEHPEVRAAAVVLDPEREHGLTAYVVPARGEVEPGDLRAHLRRRLPDYMVPSAFVVVPRLPVTANGKMDRRALAVGRRTEPTEPEEAGPWAASQRSLAAIWADVLGRERIGLHRNFLDLGGNSLLGMRLVSRIRAELGYEVPLRALMDHPTVAELAAALEEGAFATTNPRPPIKRRVRGSSG